MRRSLVLSTEGALHKMRTLQPDYREAVVKLAHGRNSSLTITRKDARGFATAYFATFAAVLAFLI